jgi:hypothetical protein
MASTLLSTLLNRLNRYQELASIEEQFKVRDLDDAIRTLKRNHNLPFFQKKGSLKVFAGVYLYPPAVDHEYLIYLDRQQVDIPFQDRLRARYTSLQQFYEDPTNSNQVAEIWDNNSLMIGVKNANSVVEGLGQQELDSASSTTDHTVSGDASNLRVDYVNFIAGNASLAFTITASLNTATVAHTFTAFTDANYARKWYFRWVYLDAVPTSISLRFGVDSSNYLGATVTSQFSGQAFVADQWNLVAMDLNSATTTGTITTSSQFAYEAAILTGAASGTYNIGQSYLRGWELLDYWYQSKYAVKTDGATSADQELFFNSSDVYSTDSALVGDDTWTDVILYTAAENGLIDKENTTVLNEIKLKKELAWSDLKKIWPDPKPQQVTNPYNFSTDYSQPYGYSGSGIDQW